MKDYIDNFLALCKGMMQPLLTIVMAVVFFSYAATGKFSPDQVWQVVVGVIVFWFGYTAFKFGTGGAVESKDLVSVVKEQQNTINNAALDLGASVPVTVVEGKAAPVVTASAPAIVTDNDNPDVLINKLSAEIDKEAQ